jgi:hypothetical protein
MVICFAYFFYVTRKKVENVFFHIFVTKILLAQLKVVHTVRIQNGRWVGVS